MKIEVIRSNICFFIKAFFFVRLDYKKKNWKTFL